MTDLSKHLRSGNALIIVPPFTRLVYSCHGPHILQALLEREGLELQVLYASALFAGEIGADAYQMIDDESLSTLWGERMFSRLAYGLPALGNNVGEQMYSMTREFGDKAASIDLEYEERRQVRFEDVLKLEQRTDAWLENVATAVVEKNYPIVGCTTMFQQTSAAVALLNRIKNLSPETVTVIGGANCEGEMAEGIDSLGAKIDYIFSGESEATFPRFVRQVLDGKPPAEKVIVGKPLEEMSSLPVPAYDDYYEQMEAFAVDAVPPEDTWLMYETSRGCWWGQKQHCTFCGLNGQGMGFRQKTADQVLEELQSFTDYPTRNIMMTDNIMPFDYYKTLLPELARRGINLNLFYEQKANISLEKLVMLKEAGIDWIQPGIEALSSKMLRLMKKGVSAHQNVMLLRYGRACDIYLTWNLLWGFPNDTREIWEDTLAIVPFIHHLCPANSVSHLSIDRFSPYFFDPEAFGVSNIRPLSSYADSFPEGIDVDKVAYHFVADYTCGSHENMDLIRALRQDMEKWRASWHGEGAVPPELRVKLYKGEFVLIDTRGLDGTEEVQILERPEALSLLTARPHLGTDEEASAIERKLALVIDDWFIPLAVANPELMSEFESEARYGRSLGAPAETTPDTLGLVSIGSS